MSTSLGNVDSALAARALRAVIELPESVGLTSLRSLVWPMADLIADGVRLNLMSLEALAAAEHLGAEICLAEVNYNPPFIEAAARRWGRTDVPDMLRHSPLIVLTVDHPIGS